MFEVKVFNKQKVCGYPVRINRTAGEIRIVRIGETMLSKATNAGYLWGLNLLREFIAIHCLSQIMNGFDNVLLSEEIDRRLCENFHL